MNRTKMALLLALLAALALAACGGGPGGGPGDEEEASSGDGELAAQLSVYNWADYIDEQVLADYEEEFGVEIIYDTYASNEDLLAKLQAGAEGYDVIFPSDYMVGQMIALDLLAEIDISELANIGNMDPQFMNAPFDPDNKHCVPYQWGTTGIGYRAGNEFFEANPPTSWAFIFDPEMIQNYSADGINVLNDPRELPAAAAFYLGFDPNTTDPDELNQIRDLILTAKPYWKTFNSEDYPSSLLVPDEVVITHGWSGSVAQAYYETYDETTEDGNWYYAIPEEGAVKWLDNICITAASERYDTALHFVNYLLRAEVGAAITNYTYYGSPNEAAKEFILDEILEDPSIYPPDEVQAKLSWLTEVNDEAVKLYDELWTAVKAGG
ncbi:MAG: spermidine/putrescine ABC transporter substrate-binding protein [Anaerolineales bacterium]|nr:spermidine/putrescine ABC transporter substrate-binding protein [Anaerolineales bacterium]MCB0012735.1 spermidine/putrescine ABC transporter substrate-binding protein [Anaerolineales bacterium]MCB0017209.1 spermidine/putrescine ABC transporter substrate-binding protein [Anaerolineales bacterium]MCB8961409.1 spermidine/putrescine ABC transporter substrate-binding protein [Ardenticatenales bacterium]